VLLLVIALLAAAGAGYATFRKPWIGVGCLAISIPLEFPVQASLITVYTNEFLIAGIFCGWLLNRLQARQALPWRDIAWTLPFLAAVLVSAFSQQAWGLALKQELRWLEFAGVLWFAALAMPEVTLEPSRRRILFVFGVLAAVATAVSIWGLVQTAAGPGAAMNAGRGEAMLVAGRWVRAYSLFGHSNQFAAYLILIMPVTYALLIRASGWKARLLIGAGLALQTGALLCTFTRGAWLALALAWIPVFGIVDWKRTAIIVAGVLALAGTMAVAQPGLLGGSSRAVIERVDSLRHPEREDSVRFRKLCLETGFTMFRAHPLIGFGAGNYDQNIRRYFDSEYYAWEAINKHIHNLYMQIVVETGLLGLAGFLAFLGYVLLQIGAGLRRAARDVPERLILAGVLAGLLAFLFHNTTDVLTVYARGIHFSLMAGLGLALARQVPARRGDSHGDLQPAGRPCKEAS